MFERFRPAVEQVLQSSTVREHTRFKQFVQDELADLPFVSQGESPKKSQLNSLYELRARFLDWELGTGYLGFFSKTPGTRYTFTRRLEAVFQMLPPLENQRILEIGCGAGLLALELASTAEMVFGIDISFFVLDFAKRVQEIVKYENVSFQHGDAENLAFQDESFDLVICSEVLEHLLDPQRALAEIRRVTKKG
jgi:2-polyprenyl-3-methyl-5-hydroxy-6-metoxy-1,4-benzoquinol methylase